MLHNNYIFTLTSNARSIFIISVVKQRDELPTQPDATDFVKH